MSEPSAVETAMTLRLAASTQTMFCRVRLLFTILTSERDWRSSLL
jgi:hypothetical protein